MALREAENDYYEFLLRKRPRNLWRTDTNVQYCILLIRKLRCQIFGLCFKEIIRKSQNQKHIENPMVMSS